MTLVESPRGQHLPLQLGDVQAAAADPQHRADVGHVLSVFVAEGDLVVEHFHASGTRTGELTGVPADGKTLALRGIQIVRIADDKIVERWGRLDDSSLRAQLGRA